MPTSVVDFSYLGTDFSIAVFHDYIGGQIQKSRTFYSRLELEFLASINIDPGVVVDGGANVGNHSLFFASVLGRKVLAFEPIQESFSVLERNIAGNHLGHLIFPSRIALGPDMARATMVLDEENIGHSRILSPEEIRPHHWAGMRGVSMERLDDLVGGESVALLKLDLEGYELPALRGSRRILSHDRPVVVVESTDMVGRGLLTSLMLSYGYECGTVIGLSDNLVFFHREKHRRIITSAYAFLARRIDRSFNPDSQAFQPSVEKLLIAEVERLRSVNIRLAQHLEKRGSVISRRRLASNLRSMFFRQNFPGGN